ncbi:hypothetical protein ALC62_00487 [Cyphomyrmex costatus]|uniref:Uncharacterized protein n=1 Tax=Cyphomyrmex costatus TaxID=456900 RepID=A0A195D6K2_9HYME|nr:hypothetical protein ALC62_00487 [Cyphomyrmex costatus]
MRDVMVRAARAGPLKDLEVPLAVSLPSGEVHRVCWIRSGICYVSRRLGVNCVSTVRRRQGIPPMFANDEGRDMTSSAGRENRSVVGRVLEVATTLGNTAHPRAVSPSRLSRESRLTCKKNRAVKRHVFLT